MEITFSPDDIPSPERIAEWQDMIDSLRDIARKELDRWEREFLDSVEAQLHERSFLTPKQRAKLEEIHAEHLR
jgi:hypothetical protein